MLKTLLKKQFLEINSFYFFNQKTGKLRSKGNIAVTLLLFIAIYGFLAFAFFGYAGMMCSAFVMAGLDWLYFAMMSIIAILLGLFGSVFNTYTGLYLSKDNDMLLAMPIKPIYLIISRVFGVFLMSLLYTAIVWIPTVAMYVVNGGGAVSIAIGLLVLLCLSLTVTVLTCALGWVIAVVSTKLKNQKIITVVISLVFFAVYYFVCFRASNIIQYIVANGTEIGGSIRSFVYPLYVLGMASTGDFVSMLIYIAITAVLVFLLFFVMSKTYIRLITTNKGEKKIVYKERTVKATNARSALLRREATRFLSLPTYMLNCGLGIVFLLGGSIAAIIKRAALLEAMARMNEQMPVLGNMLPVLVGALVCLVGSMNLISAPSVSLEGQSIWVVRSLPVKTYDVLMAKANFHFYVNLAAMGLASFALSFAFGFELYTAWTMFLLVGAFAKFTGSFGVVLNLLMPNMVWTNEAIPIKRGGSVVVGMFANWILSAGIAGIYYLVRNSIAADSYMLVAFVVFILIDRLFGRFFAGKGAEMFERL